MTEQYERMTLEAIEKHICAMLLEQIAPPQFAIQTDQQLMLLGELPFDNGADLKYGAVYMTAKFIKKRYGGTLQDVFLTTEAWAIQTGEEDWAQRKGSVGEQPDRKEIFIISHLDVVAAPPQLRVVMYDIERDAEGAYKALVNRSVSEDNSSDLLNTFLKGWNNEPD